MTLKTSLVMILIISIWLYVGITLEYNQLADIPMPVMAIILAVAVAGGYKFMLAREERRLQNNPKIKRDSDQKIILVTFFGMIAGVTIAALASLATSFAIDAESRKEIGSYFKTCERDSSQIRTLPVEKSVNLKNGGKLTVHNVTYNVPQDSEKPQDVNAWYCGKATLVEVTVERGTAPDNDSRLRDSDIKLEDEEARRPGKISQIDANRSSSSAYSGYLDAKNIEELRIYSVADKAGPERGWLVYSVADKSSNNEVKLFYPASDGQSEGVITLPSAE